VNPTENMASTKQPRGRGENSPRRRTRGGSAVESTYREVEYIGWLAKNEIPVVVALVDGEELRGWIEYFDRDIIRLTRDRDANLFIYKERIKYLYEDPQAGPRKR